MSSDKPPIPATVPVLRCGIGGCLNVDRRGEEIILYQTERPEVQVVLTITEYNKFVAEAEQIKK